MTRRAEQVDETRLRITEAAVRLHTSVGPASTSIASVAEEAGVTRVTVYRHFSTLDELFVACTTHWRALNPPPDASAWLDVEDLESRATRAFGELYGWYATLPTTSIRSTVTSPSFPPGARRAPSRRTKKRTAAALVDDSELAPERAPGASSRSRATSSTWRRGGRSS